ncbi:transcription initiation factor IIF [Colletotrichum kahawae]|uniref:Transcription initiation factor IIF n=1 Tax=Colletotrichum kahawae TaxID=34407 RepID=A0AAD9XXM3_COLKA|nr:transcription initiation factor IIF [Colletotrichum kahawae]
MCYYRLAIYGCKHTIYGRKMASCKVQQDFLSGKRALECTKKNAHSLQTLRLDSDCEKCRKLDELQLRTKQALQELREGREGSRGIAGSSMQDSLVDSSDDVTSDLGSPGAPTCDDTANTSHDV